MPYNMATNTSMGSYYQFPIAGQQMGPQDSDYASETESDIVKRPYEKWSQAEQQLLVSLWAANFERLESKDSRKVWTSITDKVNQKFNDLRPKRTTDKLQKKIKYLLDRYKKAKDWNKNQSGGHRRQSLFYDEFDKVLGCRDTVTLNYVEEAGTFSSSSAASSSSASSSSAISSTSTSSSTSSSSSTASSSKVSSSPEEAIQDTGKKETSKDRKERKKSRKREAEKEQDDDERKFLKTAVEGLHSQREDMNAFIQNFTQAQSQQLNTMNTLVGAIAKFLEKQ